MTKVSAPYLYRKRGIYYLQKRIPTDLVPHYGANSIQKSLRTRDRALLDRGWGKAKVEVVAGAEGSYLDVLRAVNERVLGKRNETQT